MRLFDLFRRQRGIPAKQVLAAAEMVPILLGDTTASSPGVALRRAAADIAVFVVAADLLDRPSGHFDPFLKTLIEGMQNGLAQTGVNSGRNGRVSALVEVAYPIVSEGWSVIGTPDQIGFGRELAAFIDPALDLSLASVSLALSFEFGGKLIEATKLLKSLPF